MKRFQIQSTGGDVFGVYPGDTPEAAFAAMIAAGGGAVGEPHTGTADDWIIVPASTWVIEARDQHGHWAAEHAGAIPVTFDTEREALVAIGDLVIVNDWKREDLRAVDRGQS